MTGAAEIRVHRDPLQPADCEIFAAEPGQRVIDWLSAHYPAGLGAPVTLDLNGRKLPLAKADRALQPGDLLLVLVQPGVQAIGPLILQAVITAAIAAVSSIAFSLIFKPKRPHSQEMPAPDPIYSITGAQNGARLGDPVPVLYGSMVTVPDYASQPYVYFEGNNQYLAQLLCIGQGEYELTDLLVGETPVSAMESGAVEYWLFGPADHGQVMGTIEAATGIMENVVTSAEVGDQELLPGEGTDDPVHEPQFHTFTAPNTISGITVPGPPGWTHLQVSGSASNDGDYTLASYASGVATVVESSIVNEAATATPTTLSWFPPDSETAVGPFVTNKPGVRGDRLTLDFVWPGGLYEADETTGELLDLTSDFRVEYQEITDAGAPVGGFVTTAYSVTARSNTPIRRSYSIAVPPGRYRVKVTRLSPEAANARQVNNFVWAGLKFRIVPSTGPVYGPVTLLAVRIRATNGIASAASSRLRASVTRRLPPLGSGAAVPSTSPADAFCDVYANPVYGAGRPLAEIDLPELARIAASWGGQAHFNGGFAQRGTVWEALSIVLQTANASPLPLGHKMSLAQEGVKAVRRQLFTDANMLRGTLAVGYTFDKPGDPDGVRVEYRDPVTWNPLTITWPPEADQPDQVQVFGCSDTTQAAQFAQLLWNKRQLLRKTAHFETELEGLLARLGDRIGVAADLPRWGMSGVVVGATVGGETLWLDKPPDWSGSGHRLILRDERGQPCEPIPVTPGSEANAVVLASPPPFPILGTGLQEPTHYVFGDSVQLVRDFTVQRIEPSGGVVVSVEALAYDPAAFADTLPWLESAT